MEIEDPCPLSRQVGAVCGGLEWLQVALEVLGRRRFRRQREAIEDRERAARYAAVLGIVAALNIPLVHFSVYWWRTLHQPM